jgi:hypothetical protein
LHESRETRGLLAVISNRLELVQFEQKVSELVIPKPGLSAEESAFSRPGGAGVPCEKVYPKKITHHDRIPLEISVYSSRSTM